MLNISCRLTIIRYLDKFPVVLVRLQTSDFGGLRGGGINNLELNGLHLGRRSALKHSLNGADGGPTAVDNLDVLAFIGVGNDCGDRYIDSLHYFTSCSRDSFHGYHRR